MAQAVLENWGSRSETIGERAELRYQVFAATSRADAVAAVVSVAPLTYQSMFQDRFQIVEENPVDGHWRIIVPYVTSDEKEGESEDLEPGESRVEFDTMGGTQRIFQAFSSATFGEPYDPVEAIVVNQDNEVEGIDVPAPALQVRIHKRQSPALITATYARTVASLVGKTNDALFLNFGTRELLFLGATGLERGDGVNPLCIYHFRAGEHLTNITVGGIPGVSKEAHDILWARYGIEEDVPNDNSRPVAQSIIVQRVHDEGDMTLLQAT
jgi:hypothetical protein